MEVAEDRILHRTLVERVLNLHKSDSRRLLGHLNSNIIDSEGAKLTYIAYSSYRGCR
jgi:hypothetical protein